MLKKRNIWRALVGLIAGVLGAIGLTGTIYPIVMLNIFGSLSLESLVNMKDITTPIILLWAIGGAAIGWYGGARFGGIVLGICGLVAGLTLGLVAVEDNRWFIIVGILISLGYSIPGGLIMGSVFPKPTNEVAGI
jgi:hypothetical protein